MLLNCGVGEDSWESLGLQGSYQSILKEISPGCSLEGLKLKLKLQYFDHLTRRADSFEKTLMLGEMRAGGEGANRGWDGWMASLTWWMWVWVNSRSWWWTGRPGVLWFMGSQRVRHDWATELNWVNSPSSHCSVTRATVFPSVLNWGSMVDRKDHVMWNHGPQIQLLALLLLTASNFYDLG